MFRSSLCRLLVAAATLMLSSAFTPHAMCADAPAGAPPAAAAAAAPSADQQKAMADAWAAAAKPGPEHEWLAKSFAGDWDAAVKFVGAGGSGESHGAMHCKTILGGRFVQFDYDGNMDTPDGKTTPFKGMGVGAYDNGKKKFVNFWIDEMSTGTMVTEGTREGNVLTMDGQTTEPTSGQAMKVREVVTVIDDTHHKYELYMTGPDGTLGKVMEIVYTKKG
jgi:hypothetical protein